MDISEMKKRLIHGLIRQEYFYIPVTEHAGTGVDIVIELEDDDGNPAFATGVYIYVNNYTYPYDWKWNNEEHTSYTPLYTAYGSTYVFESDFRWELPMTNLSDYQVKTPNFAKNPPEVEETTSKSIYDTSASFYFEPRSRVIIKNVFPGYYGMSVYTNSETRIRSWLYAPGQWDDIYEGKPWMPISYTSMPYLQISQSGTLSGRREWYYSANEPPYNTNAIDFYTISNPFKDNTIRMVGILKRMDFTVTEKYITKDAEDIVSATAYQSTSRMLNWGDRPDVIKDYVKTLTLKCDDPGGMQHLDMYSVDMINSGENTKELRFTTYGYDVYSYTINGLMSGNYELSENFFSAYATGIDSARYRHIRKEYSVSFKDEFVDSDDPAVDVYNVFRNSGEGTAEAIMFDNKYSVKFRLAVNTNDFGDGMITDDDFRIIIPNSHVVDNMVEQKYSYNKNYDYDYYRIANDNSCYTHNYKYNGSVYQQFFIIKRVPTVHFKACWVPAQYTASSRTYYYEDIWDSIPIPEIGKKPVSDKKYYVKGKTDYYYYASVYDTGIGDGYVLRTAAMNGKTGEELGKMGLQSNVHGNDGYCVISNSSDILGIKVYLDDEYLGYITWPAHEGPTNLGNIVTDCPNVALPGWYSGAGNLQRQNTIAYTLEGKQVYKINRQNTFDKERECVYKKNSFVNDKSITFSVPTKYKIYGVNTSGADFEKDYDYDLYGWFSIPGIFASEELQGNIMYSVNKDHMDRGSFLATKYENENAKHQVAFGDGMTAAVFAACCMSPTYTFGFE